MAYKTDELLSRFHESRLTQKAFSQQAGIPLSTLQYHIQKQRRSGSSAAATSTQEAFVPIKFHGGQSGQSTVIIVRGEFSPAAISELIRSLND